MISKLAGSPGREEINAVIASSHIEVINSASVEANQIKLIHIRSFDRTGARNARIPLNIEPGQIVNGTFTLSNAPPSTPIKGPMADK